uniref:Fer-1-like protein 4 n=1 Tax=Sinocyclocheilus grahami TaxID=75366 RepID=A0A672KT84_SINGR
DYFQDLRKKKKDYVLGHLFRNIENSKGVKSFFSPQVNVNVIEAQKLVGVNINPAVYVTIGDEKKRTATQKSTNCPFYNENFMFEFQETQDVLFDKVIEISVVHKKILAFLMTHMGTFKIDISTVYQQPDHRFYQKWAPLTDPKDTRSGIKGYVKCTVSVVMKGDPMGMVSLAPAGSQNDDIEKNLLLPKRMPSERPWAKFVLKIFRAEGLPSMNSGFMGKIMRDKKVFLDPYVQVTFAGQKGETSVDSNTNAPEWNEQISFIEQFPPLARRIKIQILDDANIGDVAVATHFLDLLQISNPNRNGFNPTFGPTWVNLYGSPQNSTLRDIHRDLNEGLSEGIFYRGRILLSLSVEVYSSPTVVVTESKTIANVKSKMSRLTLKRKSRKSKEKTAGKEETIVITYTVYSISFNQWCIHYFLMQNFTGEKDEFLLFASFFEVTMIDPCIGSKPVTFELSIGNYGKTADVVKSSKRGSQENLAEDRQPLLESDDELERDELLNPGPQDKSVTPPRRPQPTEYDRSFSCIPLFREKPCIFVWSYFEDHTFRFHNSNWLSKMADRLASDTEQKLNTVSLMSRITNNGHSNSISDLKNIAKRLRFLAIEVMPSRFAEFSCVPQYISKNACCFFTTRTVCKCVCVLMWQPQSTLPDVFLWMLSGARRVAYARIPAHSILFSLVEEEKGKDCGKITTVYMKTPGGPVGEIFAKLEVYMWLGITKYAKNCVTSLPAEFRPINEESFLLSFYPDSRYFQLRAHIYQARGIIAADDNGLSDPFAKVVFSTQCQVTRVMEETLSPTWSELLLYDQVLMEGSKDEYREDPPLVIIKVYDYNKLGSPQALGSAFAKPELKFVEEPYKKPQLQFFEITKGKSKAGEILAALELIELDYSSFGEVLYWGLRDLKRVNLFEVERPQVRIECAGQMIESEEIQSYKLNPNFNDVVKHFDVELPELVYLHPPLTIFVMEQRAFGRLVLVGTHVVQNLVQFGPRDQEEWKDEEEEPEGMALSITHMFVLEEEPPEKEELDWWSKYYASLAELENQLYKSELENEFSQFMDWLHIFTVYKGKSSLEDEEEDESTRYMGKYKGSFLMYPIASEDEDADCQITNGIPKNAPIKVLVRVYVVKATNLAPTDPNGKADPYVVVKVGQQQMDSKERYIPKQLNPVFGEVFELTVSFPLETELTLYVFDHDLVGSDDLIGETRVDLENRFYSRHRAGCGLALHYDKDGYNKWRDAKKPTAILLELCRKNGISPPEYRESEIKVLNKIFKVPNETEEDYAELDEHKALSVLQRWKDMREFSEGACPLVPEHVEVRSLLNAEKPGLPQGYVHMWIDMFPVDVPPPPPVNIKPRLPESYEMRVIIWNTDDVVLDDVNPFTGEPSSDIYIKGWIKGLENEKQETDVHFNSLTGEGNFNWRFVFHFDYLPTEKEVIYKKKESLFALEETEFRQPAVLVLQVWDYDRIGSNDFLGSIELRLGDMVRAAKSCEQCSIKMAKDKAGPRFSIFRSKRMKGWWPLIKLKIEAEFHLVTAEEAEKNPVGIARKEPEPLDKPNRPKTSFNWFVNPLKTFVFFIWKKYKKYIIALIILVILVLFLFLILYTLPTHISQLIVNG